MYYVYKHACDNHLVRLYTFIIIYFIIKAFLLLVIAFCRWYARSVKIFFIECVTSYIFNQAHKAQLIIIE